MRISKMMFAAIFSAVLVVPAFAQTGPAAAAPAAKTDSANVKMDITPFFNAVDIDKDNQISTAEWLATGIDAGIFKFFDEKSEGFFTKEKMANMTHPVALDGNKDGKVTLEEMQAFIKTLPKPDASAPAGK